MCVDICHLLDDESALMRPNKAETAVHGCHCPGDTAVRIRKVLAGSWVGYPLSQSLRSFGQRLDRRPW